VRYAVITREKVKFVGRLAAYYCFLNVNYRDYEKFLFEEERDEHQSASEFNAEIKRTLFCRPIYKVH